ncbi:Carboxylesterase A precursor [Streptomyces sp. YIM 130001]|uniref:alpha/beta hydrolase n=1 Tax=Streptomyces sp. YIM 130001 TaxID=2259644 RepID=UPI000E64D306|nr:alpha/beta hydrolase [Streptomyces sp. YIM 130001]RII16139.1 Carboxylesterase A precursor [Streptomyces sp. YIM 130001]
MARPGPAPFRRLGAAVRAARRPVALVATLALVGSLAVGCDSGDAGSGDAKGTSKGSTKPTAPDGSRLPASLTGQQLDWSACKPPDDGTAAPGEDWQCATMKAPLDYDKPSGETLGIALVRKKSTGDSGDRVGSLLFNFGGPGGSGVSALPPSAAAFATLGEAYDLVSFDPRGVAASKGVRCRDDAELEKANSTVDLTPDDAAEEKAYFADAAGFGKGCEQRSGKVLPHISTSAAARDMDLMRHVLGDDKLHYLGFSYGTELGGTYAHLFPKHVGRMVLDAVVDPTGDAIGHSKNQTRGFQRALENFLKAGGQKPDEGSADIAALLKRIDRKPLPATGDRELNESLAETGIVQALYSKQSWPALRAALKSADEGDGGELLALADQYNDRDAAGRYGTQSHSQRAISCADAEQRPTPAQARKLLPEFEKISPVFGTFLGWDTAGWCHQWPVDGERRTPAVQADGADPILVVGTTGDPATPFEGSERMAEKLGKDVGVHLTYKGEGHGAYASGSTCVDSAVNGYLLAGEVPDSGKVCS